MNPFLKHSITHSFYILSKSSIAKNERQSTVDEVCSFPLIIHLYHRCYWFLCWAGLKSRRHIVLQRDRKTHHTMQSKHMTICVHSPHNTGGVWIISKSMELYGGRHFSSHSCCLGHKGQVTAGMTDFKNSNICGS